MKVYVAGKIGTEGELELLEKVDKLCKSLGFKTFLPHRDVGIAKGLDDVEKIFNGDIIEGFKGVNLVVAVLDGLHVGAGTAWELGYAYAKKKRVIGLVEDKRSLRKEFRICVMCFNKDIELVEGLEELRERLMVFKDKKK